MSTVYSADLVGLFVKGFHTDHLLKDVSSWYSLSFSGPLWNNYITPIKSSNTIMLT